jgi:hypothetical protein
MVLLALEQFMIVRLYLQQAKILGLVFTSYDYRNGLSACYDCMAGFTEIFTETFQQVMCVWLNIQQSMIAGMTFQEAVVVGLVLTKNYDHKYVLTFSGPLTLILLTWNRG